MVDAFDFTDIADVVDGRARLDEQRTNSRIAPLRQIVEESDIPS